MALYSPNANDRVLVTDQTSMYRGRYGTVTATAGADACYVRIDGMLAGQSHLFNNNSINATSRDHITEY